GGGHRARDASRAGGAGARGVPGTDALSRRTAPHPGGDRVRAVTRRLISARNLHILAICGGWEMKKAARKLVLARETLKILSDRSLKAAAGGLTPGLLLPTHPIPTPTRPPY